MQRRTSSKPRSSGQKIDNRFARMGVSQTVLALVQHLDDQLSRGALVPGQRLVESDLMQEHNVGRMPVREALRILAGDGVVELSQNRGARIRSYDEQRLVEMLEVLTGLFGVATRLFSERCRGNPEAVAALRRQRDRINDAIERGGQVSIGDEIIKFHELIASWSGNSYLTELIERAHVQSYNRQLVLSSTEEQTKTIAAAYEDLTEAIIKGDWAAVEDLTTRNRQMLGNALLHQTGSQ